MLTKNIEKYYGEFHHSRCEHSFGRTGLLLPTFAPRHSQRSVHNQGGRKSNSGSQRRHHNAEPRPAPPRPRSRCAAIRASGPPSPPGPARQQPEGRSPRAAGPGRAAPHSAIVGGLGEGQRGGGDSRTRPLRGRGSNRARTARPRGGDRPSATGASRERTRVRHRGGNRRRGPRTRHGAAVPERGGRGDGRCPGRWAARAQAPRGPGYGSPGAGPSASPAVTCAAGSCCPRSGVRGPAAAAIAPDSGAGCVDGGGWAQGLGSPLRAVKRQTDGAARPAAGRQAAMNSTIVTSGPRTRAGPRFWPRRLLPEMAPAASRCSQAPLTTRGRPVPVAGALARHRSQSRPRARHLSRDSTSGNHHSNARETR